MRAPLLTASRAVFSLLSKGPPLLRRAVYDALPIPFLVTGHPEKYVVSTADKVIGRELFLHGEFDFAKLQTALAIIEREGLPTPTHLIDVGANIGTITIPAIKRGLVQTATAIEPHPGNLRLLRANLALNGVEDSVTVLAQAVGNQTGVTLYLHESATNSGNHTISTNGIPVRSTQLDDLSFPPESLLWMDIEGYEGHALMGAVQLLSKGMPVVCECNPAYLAKTNGMVLFEQAMNDRVIFDLKGNQHDQTCLAELTEKYRGGDNFTDILAIEKSRA